MLVIQKMVALLFIVREAWEDLGPWHQLHQCLPCGSVASYLCGHRQVG